MSAGAGDNDFDPSAVALAHAQRSEIFMRLSAMERQVDRLTVTVEEGGKTTEHRLSSVEAVVRDHRAEAKSEHDDVEGRIKDMEAALHAVERAVAAARLSSRDILVATSPLSVAIVALIGVLISGGAG